MRKVASAAGVSLGNLQHYFQDKQALLRGMAQALRRRLADHFEQTTQRLPNPLDRLMACAKSVLEHGPGRQVAPLMREFLAMTGRDEGIACELKQAAEDCRRVVGDMLRSANPSLTERDARMRAANAISLLSGALTPFAEWDEENDAADYRAMVLETIVRLPFPQSS